MTPTFRLYGRCQACNKPRFFIRKRTVVLPTGATATSQKLLCTSCYNTVQKATNLHAPESILKLREVSEAIKNLLKK